MRASRLIGSVLSAGAFAAVLTGVLVGAAGSDAAAPKRTGTIAFIRLLGPGPDHLEQLFSVRADGSGLRPVTPRDNPVFSYAWSPDGKLIAYIDRRTFSLWLVRPDGTGHRLLLSTAKMKSLGLSWSPDGKAIAIVTPGPNAPRTGYCAKLALYIVPIGGGKRARVSPPRRGIGCGVAWSPLGGEIAYGDGGEVLGVIPTFGGRPRLLLTSGVGAPQWSPNGTKLAAPTVTRVGRQVTARYNQITVVNADGSNRHVLTDDAYTEYPFAWSPDSRQILYGKKNRQGIYVIGADGRGDHRITRDSPREALWGALAWSPDGGSIVYATTRTGTDDLYVIDRDGHNKVRLTNSPASEIDPSWQPHQNHLAMSRRPGGAG
jgi:dipeptidyl aminopeptidase/acylaminoacyl peptidase